MIALVDGDIVAYRVAAASEDTDEEICILRCDKQMQDILYLLKAEQYKVFLSGSGNFRKTLYPEYKANRKDKPKPKHLQLLRTYLTEHWNAVLANGCEADDLLGVHQTDDTVICSIDKDLLQIPGTHYNWVKGEFYEQNWLGGIRHFYEQLLKGDRTDNIPGVDGIGEKKASRYLEGCETEQEMYETCLGLYEQDKERMWLNGKLLWIWRKENDIWNPELLEQNWTGQDLSAPPKEQELQYLLSTVEVKSSELMIQETD